LEATNPPRQMARRAITNFFVRVEDYLSSQI
jgi:hypothetical protein